MRIERHVAIVTGAARGIGFGIAQALSGAGLRVVLADCDGDAVQAATGRLGGESVALGVGMDVADAAGWERLLAATGERFGPPDVLVNNAGISPRGTAESTDEADWDRTLDTNLKGAWLGIRAALPTRGDREHWINACHAAASESVCLQREQGRSLGADEAGCVGISTRWHHLQHDCARMGGLGGRASDSGGGGACGFSPRGSAYVEPGGCGRGGPLSHFGVGAARHRRDGPPGWRPPRVWRRALGPLRGCALRDGLSISPRRRRRAACSWPWRPRWRLASSSSARC
jgi:hypothetical protein